MRVLMLEAPEDLLAERARLGHDRFDEMWEGVLHMVPFPSDGHQRFSAKLFAVLLPYAEAHGLVLTYETGLYKGKKNYRGPDLVATFPHQRARRGVEGDGCELVVEILSPGDESYDKLEFYEDFPVREVLIVDPEARTFELFAMRRGKYGKRRADRKGRVRSKVLDVTFATRRGPKLEIEGALGTSAI